MNQIAKTISRADSGYSAVDRALRQRLLAQMAQLRSDRLVLEDALGVVELGIADAAANGSAPTLHVLDGLRGDVRLCRRPGMAGRALPFRAAGLIPRSIVGGQQKRRLRRVDIPIAAPQHTRPAQP